MPTLTIKNFLKGLRNEMPVISIIVPVYNVEKYLPKCIDSILAQTFTDFELILVDDGSPDRCGEICDEYAGKDSRIVVIHKENGGQSSARNMGLDIARGEYIGFVDSDDYIAKDMYETLYNNLVNNNADISICGIYHCYINGKIVSNKPFMSKLVDNISALRIMIEGIYTDVSACNKLYKRNIFDALRYPVGTTCEDLYLIADIMLKISSVYIDTTPKYYYLHREGSTTTDISAKNDFNRLAVCKRNLELVNEHCPQISCSAQYRIYRAYTALLAKLMVLPRNERIQYNRDIKEAVSAIRGDLRFILKQPFATKNFKLSCLIIYVSPRLFAFLKKCYYNYIKKGLAS